MREKKLFYYLLFAIIIITQSVYLLTLNPDITWGDSGEFITTAYTLGIAHPTGYPLYILLTHLLCIFSKPESVAWWMNYFSALSATAAMVVLFILLNRFFLCFIDSGKIKNISACSGTLIFSFSQIVWEQSIITEVYSFQLLLLLCIFWLFLLWFENGESRYLVSGFMVLGLGFSHHLLTIILIPVILLFLYIRKNELIGNKKIILFCLGCFLIGLSCILYLPIRSAGYPVMNWGNVQYLSNLLDMVTGGQFRLRMLSTEPGLGMPSWGYYMEQVINNLNRFGIHLWEQFIGGQPHYGILGYWLYLLLRIVILLITGIGFIILWGYKKYYCISILLLFLAILLIISNYHIVDIDAYYIPAFITITIGFTIGLTLIIKTLLDKYPEQKILYKVILLFFISIPFITNYRSVSISEPLNLAAYYYGRNILESVEDNAIIITSGDNDIFPLWYWKYVHKLRPDVTIFGGNFITSAWYSNYFRYEINKFEFRLYRDLFRTQKDWAEALLRDIIEPNEINRPIYKTFYNRYIAENRIYIPIGNFIPDAELLPEYIHLSSNILFRVYREIPDFVYHGDRSKFMLGAKFENGIYLLDCIIDMGNKSVRPGDRIEISYYWKTDRAILEDIRALVMYPDEFGEVQSIGNRPNFAHEFQPIYNIFPTSQWVPNVIYKESYIIVVPLSLSAGIYYPNLSLGDKNGFIEVISSSEGRPVKTVQCGLIKVDLFNK